MSEQENEKFNYIPYPAFIDKYNGAYGRKREVDPFIKRLTPNEIFEFFLSYNTRHYEEQKETIGFFLQPFDFVQSVTYIDIYPYFDDVLKELEKTDSKYINCLGLYKFPIFYKESYPDDTTTFQIPCSVLEHLEDLDISTRAERRLPFMDDVEQKRKQNDPFLRVILFSQSPKKPSENEENENNHQQ
jgi:hypothetical protein